MSVQEQATPPTSTPWIPVWSGGGLAYKGDWVDGTYQDGDVVVKDGMVYMCVGGPTVVAPDPVPWGAAALSTPPYMTLIQDQVLAVAGSFSFTGIPATFRSLSLIGLLRGDTAANNVETLVRCNGDTGNNYMKNIISGYGSFGVGGSVGDSQPYGSFGYAPAASQAAGHAGLLHCEFPFYATTTFWKGFVGEMAGQNVADATPGSWHFGCKWKNTAAINRIDITAATGNFLTGSRVALYGVN